MTPPPLEPQNRITGFTVEASDGTYVRATVNYSYTGDRGADNVVLTARPKQGQTEALATASPCDAVRIGDHSGVVEIYQSIQTGGLVSEDVDVCMLGLNTLEEFACTAFKQSIVWQ